MPNVQSDWIVPLVSTGVGAVLGALITVVSEWSLTSIKESAKQKTERRVQLRAWWTRLRSAVHRFDLLWSPWAAEDHPNFDEPKPWIAGLFEELLELRSSLGPCEIRSRIDEVTKELSRIQLLRMEYLVQAAEAYKDLVTSCNKLLEELRKIADSVPDD
jgi:hypothetical protein